MGCALNPFAFFCLIAECKKNETFIIFKQNKWEMSEKVKDFYIGIQFREPIIRGNYPELSFTEQYAVDLQAIKVSKNTDFNARVKMLLDEYQIDADRKISSENLSSWRYVIYEDHNTEVMMYLPINYTGRNEGWGRDLISSTRNKVTLYKPTAMESTTLYMKRAICGGIVLASAISGVDLELFVCLTVGATILYVVPW